MRPHFRFEDLEIWQLAREMAVLLHRIAGSLDAARYYKYAEQLRSAGLSIANNIAEGSGSIHEQEFLQFLNIARRSLFEDASMILIFEELKIIETEQVDQLLERFDKLSRKITTFSQAIKR